MIASCSRLIRSTSLRPLPTAVATTGVRRSLNHASFFLPSSFSGGTSLVSRNAALTAVSRTFSSSSSSKDLSEVLAREAAEEVSAMPLELEDLKSKVEANWRIVDDGHGPGGCAIVKLYKKDPLAHNGAKVAIVFHCQDQYPIEEEGDDNQQGEGEEDDDEEAAPVRFTTTVTKAGKTMAIMCVTSHSETKVLGVAMANDSILNVENILQMSESVYQGPAFDELADELQESFTTFLQTDCGVDHEVATFVAMYSDYKEQLEYLTWIKDVRNVIE